MNLRNRWTDLKNYKMMLMMNLMELAKKRYTVRKFSDKAVEKEKFDKLLEMGNIAPTGKNLQP